jgi:hypothetical protein
MISTVQIHAVLVGDRYEVTVTPTQHKQVEWRSDGPISGTKALTELERLGFHQQDIVDALAAADPGFVEKLNRGDFNHPR